MTEDAKAAGDGGSESKPKTPAKPRTYTVIGAIGEKGSKPEQLNYKVLGTVEATTQAHAKAAILQSNPDFPGLDDKQPGAGGSSEASRPTDLQSLVRSGLLWLMADSGWAPKLVEVEQPPPKFTGL